MKKCQKCNMILEPNDIFCRSCGTKYERMPEAKEGSSLFLKYANYIDNEALFKVAWAKEKGIIKSDFPGEPETIYQLLSVKGHTESMFRYAMILLDKKPAQTDAAKKWLRLAADNGHVASINYLKAMVGTSQPLPVIKSAKKGAPSVNATAPKAGLDGEAIFNKMEHSVVEITAGDGHRQASSSGFFVSDTGFVLTNAHAVLNEKGVPYPKIEVTQNGVSMPAVVIAVGAPADGKSDNVDLALLLAIGFQEAECVELGDSDVCKNGQRVYLIGNSLGNGTCITSGIISDAKREMPGLSYPYIMTDAAANHGNSGGPLVAESGKVIGVLVAGIQNAQGMNYAIPTNVAKEFLAYLVSQIPFPREVWGNLADLPQGGSKSFKDKIFAGVRLALDVIEFVLSLGLF